MGWEQNKQDQNIQVVDRLSGPHPYHCWCKHTLLLYKAVSNIHSKLLSQTKKIIFDTQALPRATAGPSMAAAIKLELTTFVVTEGRVTIPIGRRR